MTITILFLNSPLSAQEMSGLARGYAATATQRLTAAKGLELQERGLTQAREMQAERLASQKELARLGREARAGEFQKLYGEEGFYPGVEERKAGEFESLYGEEGYYPTRDIAERDLRERGLDIQERSVEAQIAAARDAEGRARRGEVLDMIGLGVGVAGMGSYYGWWGGGGGGGAAASTLAPAVGAAPIASAGGRMISRGGASTGAPAVGAAPIASAVALPVAGVAYIGYSAYSRERTRAFWSENYTDEQRFQLLTDPQTARNMSPEITPARPELFKRVAEARGMTPLELGQEGIEVGAESRSHQGFGGLGQSQPTLDKWSDAELRAAGIDPAEVRANRLTGLRASRGAFGR
jgi:hypothetical protein